MGQRATNTPATQRLLDGSARLRSAVASGSIPIPVEELLEAQAALFCQQFEEAELARETLLTTRTAVLKEALEAGPSPRLAEFCIRHHPDSSLQVLALRHRSLEPWIFPPVWSQVFSSIRHLFSHKP